MYDTIGKDAGRIPASALKVAGYVTGSPDIKWSAASWQRFPHAGKVRIDQSPAGVLYESGAADVFDIEQLAGSPATFAELAHYRHAHGNPHNCPYASHTNLEAAAAALDKIATGGWWHGMDAWLTDPNLDLAHASALVGQVMHGFTIRAVQWAWPSTNPHTQVPGGTLASLNLDLSVADAAWFPAPAAPPAKSWQETALALARQQETSAVALAAMLEAHL